MIEKLIEPDIIIGTRMYIVVNNMTYNDKEDSFDTKSVYL
jgi:hypothetical protein